MSEVPTPRFRPVLATSGVRPLLAATILARLPVGFHSLGIVLLVRHVTGSYTSAGIAVFAAMAVLAGTAAPLGRLVDRHGQAAVIVPAAIAFATGSIALAVAGWVGAPAPVLVACAALTGIVAPISSSARAVFAAIFDGEDLQAVYTVESIFQETIFVVGPLTATVSAALADPILPVAIAGVVGALGALVYVRMTLAREWRAPHVGRRGRGAIGVPAIAILVGLGAGTAVSFGAFEVAITAFSRAQGHPNAAGALIAAWAIGSAVGGLVLGGRLATARPDRRVGVLALAAGVAMIPATLAANLWWMLACTFVAGLPIAPMLSMLYSLIGTRAPAGMVTEAFALLGGAFPIGGGIGAAMAGALADHVGVTAAIGLSGVGAALAGVLVVALRARLASGHAPAAAG